MFKPPPKLLEPLLALGCAVLVGYAGTILSAAEGGSGIAACSCTSNAASTQLSCVGGQCNGQSASVPADCSACCEPPVGGGTTGTCTSTDGFGGGAL